MKTRNLIVTLLLIVGVAVAVPFLQRMWQKLPPKPQGMPWQIETLPGGGSKVFDLVLGKSTIREARERFGKGMELAIVATGAEPGALEAFYDEANAGGITGKVVLGAEVDTATVERFKRRAVKIDHLDSKTLEFTLRADDVPAADQAPIGTITFIPSASFGEKTALARFGQPAERIRTDAQVEHFLYPDKGLDLVIDSKGKEILQYVAPHDFARLRDPLEKAAHGSIGR